jgi:hypothetical protein
MTRTPAGAASAAPPPDVPAGAAAERAAVRRALAAIERDWHERLRRALANRLGCGEQLAAEALRFAYRQLDQCRPDAVTAAGAARLALQHAARVVGERDARRRLEARAGDAFELSLEFPHGGGRVLRRVTDPGGRRHVLRYLHPLVADCCELEPPRLVCELVPGEGREQAKAAAAVYADQLRRGTLLGRPAHVGHTRALSRRAGATPA